MEEFKYFDSEKYGFEIVIKMKKEELSKDKVGSIYEYNKDRFAELLYRDARLNVTEEECILAIEVRDKLSDIKRYYNEYDKIQEENKEAEEFHSYLTEALDITDKMLKDLNEVHSTI